MIKSTFILAVCIFLVVQIELSNQSSIRKRRQGDGISFPDPDTENRFGSDGGWWGQRRPNGRPNNRPNERPNNRPNNNGENTLPNSNNGRRTTTTAAPTTTTAAGEAAATTPNPNCVRRCLTTPEYNPVCGTNRIDYDNMSRLDCARQCGLRNLGLLRTGKCPRT